MPIESVAILGTGLIGSSVGLALRSHGFSGSIAGWDPNPGQVHVALRREAITVIADDPLAAAAEANLILLGGPVFTILEWLDRLAPLLRSHQLVTDVGSVKGALCEHARSKYNGPGQPGFLPGHPMAGKELSGAENADAGLFEDAVRRPRRPGAPGSRVSVLAPSTWIQRATTSSAHGSAISRNSSPPRCALCSKTNSPPTPTCSPSAAAPCAR
jgi:prephenate dehydrogenase